jgi:hypothetical protein
MYKIVTVLLTAGLVQACKHPLIIVGNGDIVDLNQSGYGCTLEQFEAQDKACIENRVVGDYDVNYTGIARAGSSLVRWQGACAKDSVVPNCELKVSAETVEKFRDEENVPSTQAVFCEDTSISYSQNFEDMTPGSGYPPNDLEADGWLIFGAEYSVNPYTNPGQEPTGSYGPFGAADGDPGSLQGIASNEGGSAQGLQHLNKYSDYNNSNQATSFIEGITLQERTVAADDVGTWTFVFDAKRKSSDDFGVGEQSSAYAFIKTLDSSAYFQKGYVEKDMTTAGKVEKWRTYSISLEVTEDMVGDIMQFGFSATAFNYEPSAIYYDNLFFGTCAGLPL